MMLLERRVDFAMQALRRNQWVRSVGQGAEASWVWNGREIRDEDWIDRLRNPDAYSTPVGRVRVSSLQAFVTIIEQGGV